MTYINKNIPHYLILALKLSVYIILLTAKYFPEHFGFRHL
jgi:hypothetical protein